VRNEAEQSTNRAELMERAQSGDREAFRVLFADIGHLITAFVRRRVFEADVEDVCQEVLIAIFKSRHTFQPARPFEPWLYAIVRNVIAAHLQRNRHHARWRQPENEPEESYAEDQASLAMELRDGLRQLSANQIEALKLTKISGLSLAEAAERAGTSVGSMKVRVHRAFESFKRSLQR
jgi:RNA polymerase sigma-70 factor (ECF subfamily)